jgi:hypothetical protein
MVARSARSSGNDTKQQKLFSQAERSRAADELLVLRALGDFQKRGKVLVERSLPLDRLRGAVRRQTEQAGTAELTDEQFAEILSALGARVQRVPTFVAKHPFRVTVPAELAERALHSLGDTDTNSA